MKEFPKKEVEEYWQKKEQEIGEEIKGRDMCEYINGFPEIREKTWGLFYYTGSSFYFQTFPRKNWFTSLLGAGQVEDSEKRMSFRIFWKDVKDVFLPPKKKSCFAFFSPPDYRIFIQYQIDGQKDTLILSMYSRKNRDQLINDYQKYKK